MASSATISHRRTVAALDFVSSIVAALHCSKDFRHTLGTIDIEGGHWTLDPAGRAPGRKVRSLKHPLQSVLEVDRRQYYPSLRTRELAASRSRGNTACPTATRERDPWDISKRVGSCSASN